MIEKSE